jgi:hypothetical protein
MKNPVNWVSDAIIDKLLQEKIDPRIDERLAPTLQAIGNLKNTTEETKEALKRTKAAVQGLLSYMKSLEARMKLLEGKNDANNLDDISNSLRDGGDEDIRMITHQQNPGVRSG